MNTIRKMLIAAATIVSIASIFFYGFLLIQNPFFDNWVRGQFGADFFDFSGYTVEENDAQTLEEVIDKYEPVFMSLQDNAIERLEELYQSAVTEYREEEEAGTLDRFQLTNKYLQAGRLLERTVDDAFYTLLEGMERELQYKGLPTEVISEIEESYEEAKDEKKEELFRDVRDVLGY